MEQIAEEYKTVNAEGYEFKQVTQAQFEQAEANDPVTQKRKNRDMEHVADITAPPFVEFINVHMEFHPNGPMRPDGPIVFDIGARDNAGNPRQQIFTV